MKETKKSLIKWGDKVDIRHELWREYTFPGGDKVIIENPRYLVVSDNGHRISDSVFISHYIPFGWIHLRWENDDKEKFQFDYQRRAK